jgi:ABC-type Fe3+/spermidine/putrescine transport system ATPase subunit
VIDVQNVERRWGAFSLSVTLRARAGEYLVILGPSGSGKSLLLGLIAGLYLPERGRVLLGERDVTAAPPERRGVGFVFQRVSLFPHLTVAGNIEFGLRARGVPRGERRARVEELVTLFGLSPLLDRPVTALSGGEAQRVAIARALAPRPALLLLDEPFSLVDHNARLELQEQLRALHGKLGVTALHVTHDRDEARALGQRCAVMLGGRIVQHGSTEDVFARPRCLFVSRFLGLRETPAGVPGCSEACLGGVGRCDAPDEEAHVGPEAPAVARSAPEPSEEAAEQTPGEEAAKHD